MLLVAVAGVLALGLVAVIVVLVARSGKEPAAQSAEQTGDQVPPQRGKPPLQAFLAPEAPGGLPPDPLKAPVVIPDGRHISIRLPDGPVLLFPTRPSTFVAVHRQTIGERYVPRTVWDLRDGRQVGTVSVDVELYKEMVALSPDGAHLAIHLRQEPHKALDVWSVADGRKLRRIEVEEPGYPVLLQGHFAGPGLLLTNQRGDKDHLVRLWDVRTGQCVRRFQAPMNWSAMTIFALSPGGRYLATMHHKRDHVLICDLNAGKVVAQWPLPVPKQSYPKVAWKFGFSQDGRSLHLVYYCLLDIYLATWELSTGRATLCKVNGLENVASPLLVGDLYFGPPEPLADGKVLLYGLAVVDPASGAIVHKVPAPTGKYDYRRVIGTKWVRAAVTGGERRLVVEPFPQAPRR